MMLGQMPKHAKVATLEAMLLGIACQLVSGEFVAITSSYGELVLRKSFL
jgi:hypothetical protein